MSLKALSAIGTLISSFAPFNSESTGGIKALLYRFLRTQAHTQNERKRKKTSKSPFQLAA